MSDLPNDWPVEWRDPQKVAHEWDDFASGDGAGVWRDTITDAKIDAEDISHKMGDIHVMCDSLRADSELVSDDTRAPIAAIDENAKKLSRYYAAIETELARLLKEGYDGE